MELVHWRHSDGVPRQRRHGRGCLSGAIGTGHHPGHGRQSRRHRYSHDRAAHVGPARNAACPAQPPQRQAASSMGSVQTHRAPDQSPVRRRHQLGLHDGSPQDQPSPYEWNSFRNDRQLHNYRCQHLSVDPDSTLEDVRRAHRICPQQSGQAHHGSAGIGPSRRWACSRITTMIKLDITPSPFPAARKWPSPSWPACRCRLGPLSTGAQMLREGRAPSTRDDFRRAPVGLAGHPDAQRERPVHQGIEPGARALRPTRIIPDHINVLVNTLQQTMKDPSVRSEVDSVGLFVQYENPAAARERLEHELHDIVELDRKPKQVQ